ncbi:MAG: AAA family ATPase [Magnetococcales bacterium]|nr:AAA family ATPase [Magnetococcales bacterium]
MIIQSIQAENLFKYKTLSLSGLAGARRILLSGANESGKTAIVETICLGLFGRTTALEPQQLGKAVKWGEQHGSVTITFLGADEQSYTVYRHLESGGLCQASLSRAGLAEPLAKGVEAVDQALHALIGFRFHPFVETLFLSQHSHSGSAREETIQALAGVADLDGLAQTLTREIDSLQEQVSEGEQQTAALQEQLRVLNLQEEALGRLEAQQRTAQARVEAIDAEQARWQTFANELQEGAAQVENAGHRLLQCNIESHMDSWQSRSKALGEALQGLDGICRKNQVEMDAGPGTELRPALTGLRNRLSQGTAILAESARHRYELALWVGEIPCKPEDTERETLQKSQAALQEQGLLCARKQKRARMTILMSLLVALVVGGAAGILHWQGGTALAQSVAALLKGLYAGWDPSLVPLLFVGAGATLLLAINDVGRSFGLRRTMTAIEQDLEVLAERGEAAREMIQGMDRAAQEPLPRQVAILTRLATGEKWQEDLTQWAKAAGEPLLTEEALQQMQAQLRGHLEQFRQEVSEDAADITAQQQAAHQEQQGLGEEIVRLEAEIATEQERRRQDHALREQCRALAAAAQGHTHQMAVRQLACTLLKGACQGLSMRFNRELRRFITRAAPLFTQGRYQHLRIDDALQVAAFSTLKNDFVDFNEISTGVRYQLLLAVRMALAQAMTARVGSARQFVVLDEPFVFFDRQRVRESLDALLGVSEQITQIWVISQSFEEGIDAAGDLRVNCRCEEESLVVEPGVAH